MEDLKKRLAVPNMVVKVQTVDKLYAALKKRFTVHNPLSASTPKCGECELLWVCVGSEDVVVSRQAVAAWRQMVHDNQATFTYILNGFLNQVATAKNMLGVVHGIGEMLISELVLQVKMEGQYISPYRIRNPPHPFITVVTNRPEEAWPHLLTFVARCFTHRNPSVQRNVFSLFDPLFKYVMLEPKCSGQYALLRRGLVRTVLEGMEQTTDRQIQGIGFHYMVSVLRNMQDTSTEQLSDSGSLCVRLICYYGNHARDLDLTCGQQLVTMAMMLCGQFVEAGLDCYTLTHGLTILANDQPQVLCREENFAILGELMMTSCPDDSYHLLLIAKALLKEWNHAIPSVVRSFIAMGTINILALQSSIAMETAQKLVTSLASEVLVLMKGDKELTEESGASERDLDSHMTKNGLWVRLSARLVLAPETLNQWLHGLTTYIRRMKKPPISLTSLLVSLLLTVDDTGLAKLVIDRLTEIVKTDFSQGLSLLPVYLYALRQSSCPVLRLHILQAIPQLATHKYNVVPVLRTIQGLGQSPGLKSLSVCLLTKLWKLQDRCFPNLLTAITDDSRPSEVTMATGLDELTLARAQAILEVCKLRPEQHGADMLGPLSAILNTCPGEEGAPAVAMAMEALVHICKAEVIDIMSAWKVLEGQLVSETRAVVVEKICELLALVSDLQVNTPEYQLFLGEMTRRLWLYTRSEDARIVTAAYSALAAYPVQCFKLSHFQYQDVQEFVDQARQVLEQTENSEDTIDTIMPVVPSVCFLRLLHRVPAQAMPGFTKFLNAMVREEVNNMPRGVYYTSLRQPGSSANQNKAVTGIPILIQAQYETTKQPGLRPSLAAAMLLCYDPPIEVGRDGRPRKHYAMSHGKNFQQMFTGLLHDVQIQPSDWQKTTQLPTAWAAFIERLFTSMLQSRNAEIDVQLGRDFISETEAADKHNAAWMWVRDTITDSVKRATRGNPTVQFNAILALSGLASATQRYMSSLNKEEQQKANEITEHTSHAHWLDLVIDSCMSLVDFSYSPKAGLLGLCQQRSVDDRLPASVLGQGAAVLAMCQMSPILLTHSVDLIGRLIDMLLERLPGQQKQEDTPPVMHLFHGYGLGVLLSNLVQENFAEISPAKGSLTIMKALDALETCCLSTAEYRTGSVLGVGVCMSAMCQENKTESRVHVSATHSKLLDHLTQTEPTDPTFQALCSVIASVTSTMFQTNICDIQTCDKVVTVLQNQVNSYPEVPGASLALGQLCFSLQAGGHSAIGSLMEGLQHDWLKVMESPDVPALKRAASLHGLMGLVGAGCILGDDGCSSAAASRHQQDAVVKLVKGLFTSSDPATFHDLVGIQATAAWLLGNLYSSLSGASVLSRSVPASYSYLQESSFLRAIIEFLFTAGKKGPEQIPSVEVEVCLKSLQEKITGILPPLNWMPVLSPLMKLPFSDDVKVLCVQLAAQICEQASSAALFMSSWIVPPLFNTLSWECQAVVYRSAGRFVKSVTPTVLKTFLDRVIAPAVRQEREHVKTLALQGLHSALSVTEPPSGVSTLLHEATRQAFDNLLTETCPSVLTALSQCVGSLPEATFDELTSGDCICEASLYRGAFLRTYLVAKGKQPLPLLNSCIDATFNTKCNYDSMLELLMCSFDALSSLDKKKSPVMPRVQWLLELMGHCYHLATCTYNLAKDAGTLPQVVTFAVNVFAAAISLWTTDTASATLGVTFDLFDTVSEGQGQQADGTRLDWPVTPVEVLPHFISQTTQEPWAQLLAKVQDWLINLHDVSNDAVLPDIKLQLTDCLRQLRSTAEFSKVALWTRAVYILAESIV